MVFNIIKFPLLIPNEIKKKVTLDWIFRHDIYIIVIILMTKEFIRKEKMDNTTRYEEREKET
jgi:hypothetical protein